MIKLLKITFCLLVIASVSLIGLTQMAQAQAPLPDVAVESLLVNDLFPVVDQEITITVQIRNTGAVEVTGRRMYLYIDPPVPFPFNSSVVTEPMIIHGEKWPSGDAEIAQLGGMTFTVGQHVIYAWVDPLQRITETNEANNLQKLEFTVTDWQIPWDSAEPNNDCLQAKDFAADGVARQYHFTENDVDWFKFPTVAGQVYQVSVMGIGAQAYPRFKQWTNCDKPDSFGEAKNFNDKYKATANGFAYLEVNNRVVTDTDTAYQLMVKPIADLVGPKSSRQIPLESSPRITAVEPSTFDNEVDTPITIQGEQFAAQSQFALCPAQNNSCAVDCPQQVRWRPTSFNGDNQNGDKRLEAIIPKDLPPGNYCLQVTNFNNKQTDVFSQPITITAGQPILSRLEPAQGYNDMPTILNIQGERLFTTGLTLLTGNTPASELADVTADGTYLKAFVPAGLPIGVHAVKIAYPNGKQAVLADAFTVLAVDDDLYALEYDLIIDPPAPQPGRRVELSLQVKRSGNQQTFRSEIDGVQSESLMNKASLRYALDSAGVFSYWTGVCA